MWNSSWRINGSSFAKCQVTLLRFCLFDLYLTCFPGSSVKKNINSSPKFLSHVLSRPVMSIFSTPWTVAHQAPLPMGILQTRILEWVAMPSYRRSSQPRDWIQLSPHCRRILYHLSHWGSPRILEGVAYPFSRESSRSRNWTRVSCIAGGFFTVWDTREA